MSFFETLVMSTLQEREYLLSAPIIAACQREEITLPR